jgi:hypothetical protein
MNMCSWVCFQAFVRNPVGLASKRLLGPLIHRNSVTYQKANFSNVKLKIKFI